MSGGVSNGGDPNGRIGTRFAPFGPNGLAAEAGSTMTRGFRLWWPAVDAGALRPARPAARRAPAVAHRRAHAAGRAGGELLVPAAPGGLRVDCAADLRPP